MEYLNPIMDFVVTVGFVLEQPLFRHALSIVCCFFLVVLVIRFFTLITGGSAWDFEDTEVDPADVVSEDMEVDTATEVGSALESKPKRRRPSREDVPWEGPTW